MFGDRMVLMEGEDGASGGGGQGPTQSNLIAEGGQAAADLMFTGGADQASLNPVEVAQETQAAPVSAVIDSAQQVSREVGTAPSAKQPAGPKGPDKDIRVTAQIDKVYTPGEVAAKAIYAENEKAYTYAVGASTLQAGYAAESSLLQWNEINQRDYIGRRELIDQEFPKWRKANEQLSKDIDDARAMKVNPYNYLSSVGRTGRVASILAVGISQLAAGAGNPSSVSQRLEAAVNRDIAAQKDNISQAWAGISAKRQLTQDEIALMEQQFNFEDRARAVAYAALAAKTGAAKQHAMNEVTYFNTEMVETRANALSIEAGAQARAKMATFMLDAKVASVHAAGRKADKMRAIAQQRHALLAQREGLGSGALSTARNMDAPDLSYQAGEVAAPTAPGAPVAAPTPAPAAPAQPSSAASRVATDRRIPQNQAPAAASAPPVQDTPLGTGPLANAPQAPAEPTVDVSAPTGERPARNEEKHASLLNVQGKAVRKHGSNAGAAQAGRGEPVTARGLDDMAAELRNRPTHIAIASNINDAKALRSSYPAPDKTNPIFQGPGGLDRLEAAQKSWANVQRFPELLMKDTDNIGPNGEYAAGRSNYMDPTLLPGTLRIREGKEHLLNDPKARSAMEVVINQTIAETMRVVDTATSFASQGGTGAVAGIRFSKENGLTVDAFDETKQATQFKAQRLFLGASIKAIKDRDPSGRLSDKDVEFGELLASMMNMGGATIDQLQRAYNSAFGKEGDLGSIQAAAGRVFAYIAEDMLLHLDTEVSNDIVLSPESSQHLAQKASKVVKWYKTSEESTAKRLKQQEERRAREEAELGKVGELSHLGDRAWEAVTSANPLNVATFIPREVGAAAYNAFTDDDEEK